MSDAMLPTEMIHLLPMPMVLTAPGEPDNPIVAINAAFEELTGYTASEAIGCNCRFLSDRLRDQPGVRQLREAVRNGSSITVELVNFRKDGRTFRNNVMIAPLHAEDGTIAYFMGSQMEVRVGEMTAAARQADAARAVASLTGRQMAVLDLLARGMRNQEMAATLGLSEKTIKMHRARMIERLGVATSAQAIRLAVEADMGQLPIAMDAEEGDLP